MTGRRGLAAVVTGGLAVVLAGVLGVVPASAAPFEKGHFHDVFTETFDCDGTPTQVDVDAQGNFIAVKRGPGLVYFGDSVRATVVYTNLDTGGTLTEVSTVHSRDLKVTDNGDGTLTILVLATGGYKLYDSDGNFVLSDPGQVRFTFDVDHGGTPTDPTDDVEIEGTFEQVFGSTGRNDTQGRDFCDILVLYTT